MVKRPSNDTGKGGAGSASIAALFGPTAAVLLGICMLVPLVVSQIRFPAGLVRYWLIGGIIVVVAAVIGSAPLSALGNRISLLVTKSSPRAFVIGIACATVVAAIAVALLVFKGAASTTDELAQLWHARILLSGHLSLPADPNSEFFSLDTVVNSPRWYSHFPVGGPFFVMLGASIGLPWLANTLCAGGVVVGTYVLGRRCYGELIARVSALLLCASPMFILMAGTWMNHVPTALFLMIALVGVTQWDGAATRKDGMLAAAMIGASVGFAATIRPLDAVAAAVTIGAYQLLSTRNVWKRLPEIGVEIVAGLAAVAPLLWANARTTGNPFLFGYEVAWGAGHRIGFHADPYGNIHTPLRALELATRYVSELNVHLAAWPIPAVLLLIVGFALFRRPNRWDVFLALFCLAQICAYGAYWGEGEFLGPRFLYSALPIVVLLLTRVCLTVASERSPRTGAVAIGVAPFLVLVAWGVPTLRYNALALAREASHVRQTLKTDVVGTVRRANIKNALVFFREPFGARLSRRLWGLGFQQSETVQLLASRDGCSLLAAVTNAELADTNSLASKRKLVLARADVFEPQADALQSADGTVLISSRAKMTAACTHELEDDTRLGGAPFGPALPHEPIGADGRLNGDVIFAADLSTHNEALRPRFGNRAWYRFAVVNRGGRLEPVIAPY
jgi:hypothetical protein